jgi:DNA-binding response OmpR family regulator
MTVNILLIDDETTILRSIRAYLEQEVYNIRAAVTGRAALLE